MRLIDILFPSECKCIFCGIEMIEGEICTECEKLIKYINKPCVKCGGTVVGEGNVCLECKKYERIFDRGYCVCEYSGELQQKILKFKNHNGKYLYKVFAKMMYEKYKELDIDVDVIIPMPIHKNRRKERGFNQCELLAEVIQQNTNLVDNQILIRKKDTPHQMGLDRENRMSNLDGAFELNKGASVKNKNILILDDIFTTGSTIDECARYLISEGANKIYFLCLARTPIDIQIQ